MVADINTDRRISVETLPSDSSIVFRESAFFSQNGSNCSLPSPTEVRAAKSTKNLGLSITVQFEALNLLVKYGRYIAIAEGQCLWAIRRLLHSKIPVPEVYGWCEDGGEVFIYMQLLDGVTLESKWDSLSDENRVRVCEQLRAMILELRKLQQDPKDQFLGKCFLT